MENNIRDNLIGLQFAGRNTAAHLASLSQAHVALLEVELKDQLRILVGAFFSAALAVIAGGVALILGSFALAGAITATWPNLGADYSLLMVAAGNIIFAVIFVTVAQRLLRRVSLQNLESTKSWSESIKCILQRI